jgi:hypothetical protein
MLSRAFADSASAAAWICADAFGLVAGAEGLGFRGSGGGARSGSELSHLRENRRVSVMVLSEVAAHNMRCDMATVDEQAYIGI